MENIILTGRESLSMDDNKLRIINWETEQDIYVTPEFMEKLRTFLDEQQQNINNFKI